MAGIYAGESTIYCYYDKYDRALNFFSSREDLKVALREAYSNVDTSWEDMDTSELQSWWERYEDEGEELPAVFFNDD